MPTLYFKITSGNSAWEHAANWFTDPAATVPALNAPWTDDVDTTYRAYDLALATGASGSPQINAPLGTGVTGTCSINGVVSKANGHVRDGTFSGAGFTNQNAYIENGTFTGDGFINYASILGGTYTGAGFQNFGEIFGGTFSGLGFALVEGYVGAGTFVYPAVSYSVSNGTAALSVAPIHLRTPLPQLDILGTGLL